MEWRRVSLSDFSERVDRSSCKRMPYRVPPVSHEKELKERERVVPGKKFCPVCVVREKEKHEKKGWKKQSIEWHQKQHQLQSSASGSADPLSFILLFCLFCLSVLRCSIYRLHFLVKPLYVHSLQTDWSQCQSIPPGDPNNDFNCYLLKRRFTRYSFQATILLTETYTMLSSIGPDCEISSGFSDWRNEQLRGRMEKEP